MTNFPLHILFHSLGVLLGYTVMSYAPTLGIFATGCILFVACIAAICFLTVMRARGEID